MKNYNCKTRVSAQARKTIENTIETHEYYKNCYFWTPRGNAGNRRRDEARFATLNPEYSLETKSGLIEVCPSLKLSCKNTYYGLTVSVDGVTKNISALKKLIK